MDLVKISKQLEDEEITIFDLDFSEIRKVEVMLPKFGAIDLNVSEEIATQFIRAADILSELYLVTMRWEGRMITQKKKAWGEAFYIRATEKKIKTSNEKSAYADADDEYIKWSNRATEAQAARKYIETKYQTFIKAHHLAKSAWENNKKQEGYGKRVVDAGFEAPQNVETGEESW